MLEDTNYLMLDDTNYLIKHLVFIYLYIHLN